MGRHLCRHRRWERRGTMGRCLDCLFLFAPEDCTGLVPPVDDRFPGWAEPAPVSPVEGNEQ